jgi:hypothetical protein
MLILIVGLLVSVSNLAYDELNGRSCTEVTLLCSGDVVTW